MTTVEIGRIRTNHLRQTEEKDEIFNRIPIVPIVLQVLVHASILYSDIEREEALYDLGAFCADVSGRVPQEEPDHLDVERVSGDMEWSEAVAVSGVWVNAEAAHLRGTARAQRMAFLDTMETRISGWSKQPRKLMWYPDMLQSL
jgi:hypothetical protein